MYKVVEKRRLNDNTTLLRVHAPLAAARALAGQFVIFRIDEPGERVPLTVAGTDGDTVTVIFQHAGRSTKMLGSLEAGDCLLDFVGPLGRATEFGNLSRACVVGGGVGCAIAYPTAKAAAAAGIAVDVIAGFRSRDFVILEDEFNAAVGNAGRIDILTDDGSYGRQGFVTAALLENIESNARCGAQYDRVFAIGPIPMMKAVCDVAAPFGIAVTVSLNPIMIDGTGMCGCCRVTVGGEVKFACVDGPEFDGHKVDFAGLALRNRTYGEFERRCADCRVVAV